MFKSVAAALCLLLVFSTLSAVADTPTSAKISRFDPAKHMRVSEVKPGMKGYGLSVFSGSKIERFEVEVVDVLKNFNPKYDAVLIRCKGDYLEHTGAVAGMSGSPIYLFDESGRARMIGAFAYGWPLSKDPLAGVQPIEYMLSLPVGEQSRAVENEDSKSTSRPSITPSSSGTQDRAISGHAKPHWSLDDVPMKPWGRGAAVHSNLIVNDHQGIEIRLQPLATPMMAGGMSARMIDQITPLFKGTGLVPMQAGGESAPADAVAPKFEPGSVLAVPLLTGDMDLTAIGTCTEVVGDQVFGFGHPFNGEGPISLPMGTGSIATVVANLQTSFKLGYLSKATGTLTTDQSVGVAGKVGDVPPMIPIELRIVFADGSVDETYHFKAATHPRFTPMISAAAVGAAMSGEKELPQYHTVDYDLSLDFAGGQNVHVVNRSVNNGPQELMNDIGLPMLAAGENPFKRVQLSKLTGTIRISNQAQTAQILSIMVPRSKYEPGETVKAFITYHPFHAQEAILPVQIELPRDLPNGTYQLTVSDWNRYMEDERQTDAFKFTADNVEDLFKVVKDITAIRHDAIYLRLLRQPDGIAVGRVAMPRLPSSRRQVLIDSGRSDTVPFVSSTVKIIPTDLVMSGSAEFAITIEKHSKVEVAPKGGKPDVKSGANPKPDDAGPDAKPSSR